MNSIKRSHQQMGLSLVELMVSIVIALLMTAAILQLFLDITRSSDELARTNAQMENGRFALQIMAEDVKHGGFWDGYVPQYDDLTSTSIPAHAQFAVPAPCLDYASWGIVYRENLLRIPLQSYNAVPTGCSVITGKKADTDVLVVSHAETCVAGAAGCPAVDNSKVYFQTSFCGTNPSSAYDFTLATSGFTGQKRNCTAAADKRRLVSNIYYIRDDNTLMRAEFGGGGGTAWSTQPLVDGVEGMVVELGIDNVGDGGAVDYTKAVDFGTGSVKDTPEYRGDGAPDGAFVRCGSGCSAAQLIDVVAAKIFVLVRSLDATPGYSDTKTYTLGTTGTTLGPFNDGFKRHVYSTTVRMNNVSARRETP